MKKYYLLLLFLLLTVHDISAQTLEDFETETTGATSFTSGSQSFNISSTLQGPFDIYDSGGSGYGFNGTSNDSKFIDNSGFTSFNMPVEFTISSAGATQFTLKSIYLYFAHFSGSQSVTGSCTITGKLGGSTVFTATQSAPFANNGNGFTLINMASYGAANNSNLNIDRFTVTTTGTIAYVALDAMTWQVAAVAVAPTVTTTAATTVGAVKATLGGNVTSDGGATVSDRGIVWGLTANPTTANNKVQIGTGTGTFSSLIASLPAATTINYRAYAINSAGTSYGANMSFTTNAALTATQSQTDVTCNGGSNGTASVTPSGGKTPYTYSWTTGATTSSVTGLTAGNYTVIITDNEGTAISKNFTITQPAAVTISISANPTNKTVCPGFNTSFTASALNASTYQWQENTGSGYTNITNGGVYSNATTTTLNITGATTAMQGYLYRLVASGPCSASATSTGATLTVPNIVASVGSQTNVTCNGGSNGSATISVSGGSTPYSYSWAPSGGTGATATGLTAQTYTVTITDNNSCVKTQSVIITQPTLAASTPAISVQPASTSVCTGTTATFSVTDTNTATYQWQVDDGSGFVNISNGGTNPTYSGATTATLTINSVTQVMSLFHYRVVLTSTCSNTIASDGAATLTVKPLPIAIATPSSKTICSGTSPGIALTSSPVGATFAWTVSGTGTTAGYSASSGTSIAQTLTGSGVVTYTVTPTLNGCPGTPITVEITVNPLPTASASPSSTPSICSGTSPNITLTSSPVGATFAWTAVGTGSTSGYSDSSGSTINQTLGGSGVVTYTVTPTLNGCPGTPITVTVTVKPVPVAIATPSSKTICSGTSPNIALTSSPVGATFAWTAVGTGTVSGFSDSTGTSINQTLTGSGTVTYTVTPTLNGCAGSPITVLITVNGPTTITADPVNATVCAGGNTSFSAAANNATGYQWQVNTGSGFTNIINSSLYSGAQTATLSITGATAGMNGYLYQIVATGSCTSPTSASRLLTVTTVGATPSQTNVSCNGLSNGSATVTPSGGTAPYTYLWSNGAITATATGLAQGNYTVTIKDANLCEKVQSFTITEPSVLTSSISKTDTSCNGGSNGTITLTPSGGTAPYTYLWSNSATTKDLSGLAVGTYSVTITDNKGCTATNSITVNQPSAFSVTTSQTDILCNGTATGSATVVVSGATAPYTYSWSPSGGNAATASGLVAGTYTVTITDANSCQITRNFTITQLGAVVASAGTTTHVNCRGEATGAATVNVTGGTAPYAYSWAPSGGTAATATGLTAGTYIVTVTDANLCPTTQSFTINQPAAVLSATTTSIAVSCNGGSNGSGGVITSGGTAPYTYLWAPSGGTAAVANGLAAGNYTCTITDNKGCTLVKNITIGTPVAFSSTMSKTDVSCNGGTNGTATIVVSGATAPYTYSWSPSGGNAATATGLAAGTYTVTVQDANTCTHTNSITVGQPAVLSATTSQSNILCNGGSTGTASVSVSGGTPGYTYLWSPSGGTAATATGLAIGSYSCLITDAKGCILTKNFTLNQPATLTATTSQTNATCTVPGQATVTASGGTAPYTYSWAPSGGNATTATGLVAGNYSCLITDANGCAITKNFTITGAITITATTSQVNILCNGGNTGSASVVPTGGIAPYTYTWSPSGGTAATATGLTAGNYSCLITDVNGCAITKNFTITEPSALTATQSQTNILCFGGSTGSASVTVSGGTIGYTYAWTPSGGTAATATGLTAGNYTVTITDGNGCTLTKIFTITEQPALIAAIGTQNNVSCNGGTNGLATVNVTGGTGTYTYVWAPSGGTAATASGLAAGTYTVTIKDANLCQTTQSFTITEPTLLAATQSQTNILCFGGSTGSASVIVSGGTTGYTYAWAPSGGTAATATGLTAGNYTVTITDGNGCTLTKNFTITQPAAPLIAITSQTNVLCFGGTNGSASVTASGGTTGYTYTWSPSGGTAATATGLTAGNYTCTITDANGCTTTKNFTITEPASPLTATTSQTNVLCFGGTNGSASVTASGGTTGYTYTWSPSGGTAATATGLTAGNYTCIITDANGCTTTKNFTITEPTLLAATQSQTNILCFGGSTGSASVTVSGGTIGYTYAWAPSGGTAATATGLTAGNYTATITDGNGCTLTKNFTITEPASPLTAITSQTNVLCFGGTNGSASVIASGGTTGYTYTWSPSGGTAATAIGLTAGNYTCIITDANGCTTTKNFTITEPILLAATSSQTNVSCNGGSNGTATVIVTGGNAGYSYIWSPSGGTSSIATGLTAGNYSVTITDSNACTLVKNFTITEPSGLSVSPTQTNVSCNGGANGSATVAITGGTAPYTYSWSPSGGTAATATGLSAGTYTVTVTDANLCQTTQSFTITQPAVLTATAGSQTNLLCNGGSNGSATVTVTGGTAPYTYSWSPSGGIAATATGLPAGTYTVTVTDANLCQTTQSFTITQPSILTATAGAQTNLLCNGASNGSATVTAAGGTAPYTYSWSPSGGTAATATGLSAGTYTVTVIDANLCQATQSFTITSPPALTATTSQTNILCFGANTGSASVVAAGGTAPYTYAWSPSGGTAATAAGLAAGTFICTITDANGCTLTKSFTITQLPALVVNGSSSNITCNGSTNGMASVSVSGGAPGYTYLWAPSGGTSSSATGLSGGTYTCTVTDANGCIATKTFTILQQTPITVTSVKTNLLCYGATNGSATLTVTGGVPNYTYVWAPSGGYSATATNLAAGTYTVTVTDALGCSVIHSVTISEPDALDVDITQNNITCFGSNDGVLGVDVSGGVAPYTYAWTPSSLGTNPSVTGLGVGNYSVTITDANGCSTLRNFSLSQPGQLTASITKTDVGCYGGNDGSVFAAISGGTPPYTYEWTSPSGGTPDPSNLVAGTYIVTITDANGCTFTGSITINQPLLAVVNSQPQDITISTGGNANYTVNATNANGYQWQVSEDGTNWVNITNGGTDPSYSGATTNSLTITGAPASHNGYLYRVLVKYGANCTIISSEAILNIDNVLEAVDDDFSDNVILAGTGGIAGDVTANDIFNNQPVNDDDVIISIMDNDGLFGAAFDSDGNLIVPQSATAGIYTITYSICDNAKPANCSMAEVIVVVSDVTGTIAFGDIKLSIYPNPATTKVFIKIPDFSSHNNMKAIIYDLNGRLVKTSHITAELESIDVAGLESGVYIFNITSDTGQASRRIIVDKKF